MSFLWQEILYRPLFNLLVFLYNTVAFHDLGIAICELTLLVRLLLLSPSLKALRAQLVLQKLQPELEALRKKYKDDRQKQTQAMMEFYQKHKIHPLSSCLPTLVQFPILIVLFWILRDTLNSQNLHLLYPFIGNPGKINPLFLGLVDLSQKGNWVLAILAAGTQFIQARMIMPPSPSSSEEGVAALTSQMTYFFPLLTLIFALQFPAGLALYWVVTTLGLIIIQYFVLREDRQGRLKPPLGQKEGWISRALKEYQKQNQKLLQQFKEKKK